MADLVDITDVARLIGLHVDDTQLLIAETGDFPDAGSCPSGPWKLPDVADWAVRKQDSDPALAAWVEAETGGDERHGRHWFEDHYYISTETWREWTAHPDFPSSCRPFGIGADVWGEQAVAAWIEGRGLVPPYNKDMGISASVMSKVIQRDGVDFRAMADRFGGITESEMRHIVRTAVDFPVRLQRGLDRWDWPDVKAWGLRNTHVHPCIAMWAPDAIEVDQDQWHQASWFQDRYSLPRSTWESWTRRPEFPLARHVDGSQHLHWGVHAVNDWAEKYGKKLPSYWKGVEARGDYAWSLRGIAKQFNVSHNSPVQRWQHHPKFPTPIARGRAHLYAPEEIIVWVETYAGSGERYAPRAGIVVPPHLKRKRAKLYMAEDRPPAVAPPAVAQGAPPSRSPRSPPQP